MDFKLERGDTRHMPFAVTLNAAPYNLTGLYLWFTAKRKLSDADGAAVFQKTVGAGITLDGGTGGTGDILILPTNSSGLPDKMTTLYYDLQMKTATGEIYTPSQGELLFEADVTKAIT